MFVSPQSVSPAHLVNSALLAVIPQLGPLCGTHMYGLPTYRQNDCR